jgi:glycosyltransferase involved in cell wall biosynthesis
VKKWLCCQIGAREHYAVPRALAQSQRLVALYTDFWAGSSIRKLALALNSRSIRSFAARHHPELAAANVISWNLRSFGWESIVRRRSVGLTPYHGYIEVGRRFALRVRENLEQRPDLGSDSILFAYDTGALEAMEWCREKGIKCVLNQMDPSRVEVELVRQEERRWPGWVMKAINVPEAYFRRREQEWDLADRIVINSEFCREALVQQGVPVEKLVVVPLCYETTNLLSNIPARKGSDPLRVLFLGQVILRKGIQYLLAAARLLERENIHFDVVGPIGITQEAVRSAPSNVTFHGRTGRGEAAAWYQRSHVFVLPTLSDGFAITQLEAMAYGLPVIATPCSGKVVRDGEDGFIVPPRDPEALAGVLQQYLSTPDLLPKQSRAAREKSKQFSLERLTDNLLNLEAGVSSQ